MDYLTQYPVSAEPATWRVNDLYLDVLQRQIEFWREKGYAWNFSAECEFVPALPEDLTAMMNKYGILPAEIRYIGKSLLPSFEIVDALQHRIIDQRGAALQALDACRDALTTINENPLLLAAFAAPEVTISSDDLLEQCDQFEAQLDSEDLGQRTLGLQNIYLAYLNIMPSDQGGLLDLIQPRFGNAGFGLGWWDGRGMAEVRLRIQDPIEFIKAYHRVVEITRATGMDFGLVADWRAFHLNFSIQKLADGKNMLETPIGDSERENFSERTMVGIYALLHDALPLKTEPEIFQSIVDEFVFSAGSIKSASLRMRPNGSWEYRTSYNRGFPHLARDASLFMIGAAWGNFDVDDLDAEKQRLNFSYRSGQSPIIQARHGELLSPIQAVLESSAINEYGHLIPDFTNVDHRLIYLQEAFGADNLGLFNGKPSLAPYKRVETFIAIPYADEEAYEKQEPTDLSTIGGMVALFQSLKMGPNGQIDLSHLHPEIAAALQSFRVVGKRTTFNSNRIVVTKDLATLTQEARELKTKELVKRYFLPEEISALTQHHLAWCDQAYSTHADGLLFEFRRYLGTVPPQHHTDATRRFLYSDVISQPLQVLRMHKLQMHDAIADYADSLILFPEAYIALRHMVSTKTGVTPKNRPSSLNKNGIRHGTTMFDILRERFMDALDQQAQTYQDDPQGTINWPTIRDHARSFLFDPLNQIAFYRDHVCIARELGNLTDEQKKIHTTQALFGLSDFLQLAYTAASLERARMPVPEEVSVLQDAFARARDTFIAKARLALPQPHETPTKPKTLVFNVLAYADGRKTMPPDTLRRLIHASFGGMATGSKSTLSLDAIPMSKEDGNKPPPPLQLSA